MTVIDSHSTRMENQSPLFTQRLKLGRRSDLSPHMALFR